MSKLRAHFLCPLLLGCCGCLDSFSFDSFSFDSFFFGFDLDLDLTSSSDSDSDELELEEELDELKLELELELELEGDRERRGRFLALDRCLLEGEDGGDETRARLKATVLEVLPVLPRCNGLIVLGDSRGRGGGGGGGQRREDISPDSVSIPAPGPVAT